MENGFNVLQMDGERINFEDDSNDPYGGMTNVQNGLVESVLSPAWMIRAASSWRTRRRSSTCGPRCPARQCAL